MQDYLLVVFLNNDVDYIEIFSPTLKQNSLIIHISIAIHYNFGIYQIDKGSLFKY